MAVGLTSVAEMREISGELTKEANEFTRYFLVTLSGVTSANVPEAVDYAMTASGIPAYDAVWPFTMANRMNPRVYRKRATMADPQRKDVYKVEVVYTNARTAVDSAATGPGSGVAEVSPWAADEVYDYSFEERDIALTIDRDNVAVLNSAGDGFDPPVVVPETTMVINVSRGTEGASAFSPTNAYALINTVNSGTFTIDGVAYGAGILRLRQWTASDEYWVDPSTGTRTPYTAETISFEARAGGWNATVIDQGYMYRATAGGNKIRVESQDPVLLNSDGTKNTTTTPNMLTFKKFSTNAWTALGSL